MPIAGTLAELYQWLGTIHPVILTLIAAFAVSLETSMFIGLVIPGDVVLLVAGTQATSPGRFALIVLGGLAGSLLGESIGYLIGRRYLGRLRDSRLGRRIGTERWDAASRGLHRNGSRAMLIGRFTPVVHALLPPLSGGARVPYRRFIGWCTLAGVLWSVAYVGAGALAGANLARIEGSFGLFGYALLAVVGGFLLAKFLLRRRAAARLARVARAGEDTDSDDDDGWGDGQGDGSTGLRDRIRADATGSTARLTGDDDPDADATRWNPRGLAPIGGGR